MTDDSTAITALAGTSLFGVLSDPERATVVAAARTKSFRGGQYLYFEGDEATSLAVLLEGRVKISLAASPGDSLLLNILHPPAVFGQVSVLDGGPRSATAEALSDGKLLLVPADEIRRLVGANPRFVEELLVDLASLARKLTATAADLAFLDLPRRVAKLIATEPEVASHLSQAEIGSRLGASRQSVNVALQRFVRRGWIELSREGIAVKDPDALERFSLS